MFDMKLRIKQILRNQRGEAVTAQELAGLVRLRRGEDVQFRRFIDELVKSGEVTRKGDKLVLAGSERGPAVEMKGEVVKVNATYGFVRFEDSMDDVFVPGRKMMGALPGDKVELKVRTAPDGRGEGEITRIVQQADFQFTGVVSKQGNACVIVPDRGIRFDVPVHRGEEKDLKNGDKVLAVVDRRGASHRDHVCHVLLSFGDSQSAKNCCASILAAAGIVPDFPEEVLRQAKELNDRGIDPKEAASRLDLREEPIFTIDSADTKDIDDAISLHKVPGGWQLGVHIADVSYYVRPGSPIDDEAFDRGTSVYYANSVVPMLPTYLSNGICSLNEGEDRLAFSALMDLDERGELKRYRFAKSLIRSKVKGVYKEINAIYDGTADAQTQAKYAPLGSSLADMHELAETLFRKKSAKGGLDLESSECKFVLDENGVVQEIIPRQSGFSENMIEEFMLLANEAAATFGMERELPFIYRIHDLPTPEKVDTLRETLEAVGISTAPLEAGATPHALHQILEAARGTRYQMLVNTTLLRSMAKAKYSDDNIGHFGLVLKNYAHFTSPIRRYPDLMIHRIMSAFLAGASREEIERSFRDRVGPASVQSSEREVRAMTAERSCEDTYKAEYMKQRLGEEFEGVISGAAGHGIYVELDNTVEGLVRTANLPGEFEYDGRMTLVEQNGSRFFRVGDPAKVKVAAADVSAGNVDFDLVLDEA